LRETVCKKVTLRAFGDTLNNVL